MALRQAYGPWGEVRSTTRAYSDLDTESAPLGLAAGLWNAGTQTYRFGARDYDPMTARWTAPDPILFEGGQENLYTYCNNDPVNCTDPSGTIFGIDDAVAAYIAGAVIAGGIDLAAQTLIEGKSLRDVNYYSVAFSSITGVAGVGLGNAAAKTGLGIWGRAGLNALGSGVIGGTARAGQNLVEGRPWAQGVGSSALLSGSFGGAGSLVGDIFIGIGRVARGVNQVPGYDTKLLLQQAYFQSLNPNAVRIVRPLSVGVSAAFGLTISNLSPVFITTQAQ